MTTRNKGFQFAILTALMLAATSAFGAGDNNGVRYYVSVGTSLSVGIQPNAEGVNRRTNQGYADQLFDIIEPNFRKIRLVKLGCPGETTVTMIEGGNCTYPKGSQLAEAVRFLRAHKDKVELITIDIGVNDILSGRCIVGNDVDFACFQVTLFQVAVNLPVILSTLRSAADPETPIIGMNYYNTFVAAWLRGPNGQVLAVRSSALAAIFNDVILGLTYEAFDIPVADVAGAYMSDNFATLVPFPTPDSSTLVPLNVAILCELTYMCVPPPVGPNIHANPTGYGVIAATFAATLQQELQP